MVQIVKSINCSHILVWFLFTLNGSYIYQVCVSNSQYSAWPLILWNKTWGLQLCPGFHFTTQWISNPRNGQNMTLLWPKHGPHMVPQIGSSWIIINGPKDAPCQILQFWHGASRPGAQLKIYSFLVTKVLLHRTIK